MSKEGILQHLRLIIQLQYLTLLHFPPGLGQVNEQESFRFSDDTDKSNNNMTESHWRQAKT